MKSRLITITLFFILVIGVPACQGRPSPTPYPTYTPYPTFTPAVKAAFPFAMTKETYPETGEVDTACVDALGPGWQTADWNDILEYVGKGNTIESWHSTLGEFPGLWVNRDGEGWYSGQRRYFAEVHNHDLPADWLSHDDIDDHYLDLGSWYDMELPVLCIRSDATAMDGDDGEPTDEPLGTPDSPPTFSLRYLGDQPCGEWPHYAVFEVENSSMWTLQSAGFNVVNADSGQTVYRLQNNNPFLKQDECPPGKNILPPFNTRRVAVNIEEPEPGTSFSAEITLCTEDDMEGACAAQTLDFVFTGGQAERSEVPFVGRWEYAGTGMVVEFTETSLVKMFSFEGGLREIHYSITDYDLEAGHMDLVTDQVLQDGEEVEYDWEPEQYLSYIIEDDVMKFFIGPNPYPNAAAGPSYTRQERGDSLDGEPAFDLAYVGTRSCAGWPHFAAFQVSNTSGHTFESVRLEITDVTHDQLIYGGNNNRGFVKEGGCPPGASTLEPGKNMEVAANIKEPEPGTEFEAVIKLCTANDLQGECVELVVDFIFDGD